MSATGRRRKDGAVTTREPRDFYETPAWCVSAIAPHLPRVPIALDPCAGTGSILRSVIEEQIATFIYGYEIDGERTGKGSFSQERDALSDKPWEPFDICITNPPYRLALDFVDRALSEGDPRRATVAMLLRLNWLEGRKRAAFHRAHPSDVYVLPRRPSFTGKGTDATAYAWFCWGPGRGNRWFLLDTETQ